MEKFVKCILVLVNLVLLASLAAWPFAAFSTLFMFDSPQSTSNPITISLALMLIFYPLTVICYTGKFFSLFNKEKNKELLRMTFMSSIGPLSVFISFNLLELICNGSFSCY